MKRPKHVIIPYVVQLKQINPRVQQDCKLKQKPSLFQGLTDKVDKEGENGCASLRERKKQVSTVACLLKLHFMHEYYTQLARRCIRHVRGLVQVAHPYPAVQVRYIQSDQLYYLVLSIAVYMSGILQLVNTSYILLGCRVCPRHLMVPSNLQATNPDALR